jgi:hypothetical protein
VRLSWLAAVEHLSRITKVQSTKFQGARATVTQRVNVSASALTGTASFGLVLSCLVSPCGVLSPRADQDDDGDDGLA